MLCELAVIPTIPVLARTRLDCTPARVLPAKLLLAVAAEILSAPAPMPAASETEAAVASDVLSTESVAVSRTSPTAVTS